MREYRGFITGGSIVTVLLAVFIYFAVKDQQKWEAWCVGQGGHVTSHTQTSVGTGFDTNGKPVTTTSTSTTYYCLTEDGRIIDIH